jgi:hypothetical protein
MEKAAHGVDGGVFHGVKVVTLHRILKGTLKKKFNWSI